MDLRQGAPSTASRGRGPVGRGSLPGPGGQCLHQGWAEGKVAFGPPPRGDSQAYASWLEGMVGTASRRSNWRRLAIPPTIDGKITTVLYHYQQGLEAYGAAAAELAAGQTEEAGTLLRRADQIGAEYRRLATQAGFRECDTALPL